MSSSAGRARCPQAPDRLSVLRRRTGLNQPAGRRSLSACPRASLARSEPGPRLKRCVRDLSRVRHRLDGTAWDLRQVGAPSRPGRAGPGLNRFRGSLNPVRARPQPVHGDLS
ncbi:hypothetical protein C0Q57_17380 [Streptomyces albidoflavus]|nr:hypothetical protein C0Q57_17380 [Streptomyces albidoflavus]RZE92734.1 hypothetical protein C0R04_17305 [Streptomyces albidoflavus]RZE93933.1 hypothetical protein C0R03_17325 [Streptomyces albidoflavus]